MLQTINGVGISSSSYLFESVCCFENTQFFLPYFFGSSIILFRDFYQEIAIWLVKRLPIEMSVGSLITELWGVSDHIYNPAVLCNFQYICTVYIPQMISLSRTFRKTLCVAICNPHSILLYLILRRYDLIAHTGKFY
jgi:hypothetical protein